MLRMKKTPLKRSDEGYKGLKRLMTLVSERSGPKTSQGSNRKTLYKNVWHILVKTHMNLTLFDLNVLKVLIKMQLQNLTVSIFKGFGDIFLKSL